MLYEKGGGVVNLDDVVVGVVGVMFRVHSEAVCVISFCARVPQERLHARTSHFFPLSALYFFCLIVRLKVWNSKTGEEVLTLKGHTDSVTCAAWSMQGHRVAAGSWNGRIIIFNPETGGVVHTLEVWLSALVACDCLVWRLWHWQSVRWEGNKGGGGVRV